MSVESFLSRELQLRFIDARMIVTEAKLALNIEGYHGEEQESALMEEAMKIFEQRPDEEKYAMRRLRTGLDSVKRNCRSNSDCSSTVRSTDEGDDSMRSDNASLSQASSSGSSGRKTFKLWPVRRR